MNRLLRKKLNAKRRTNRVRSTVHGSPDRPRLAVSTSNLNISAQIIDDESGKTLAYASSIGKKMAGTMTEKAAYVGEEVAEKAKTAKVKKVVMDRRDKKYHGRIKALAEAARKKGLEF